MHDLPLITTIAAAFAAAWVLGIVTQLLKLSPIVGYLLAGVVIGPHSPGFVGDIKLAHQLAEIGVILLMFGVGLHFHLKDLLAVKGVAIPGAIGQSMVATVLGVLLFHQMGFETNSGLVAGMALSVASTVVLMRVLMDANVLDSAEGHIAVGWLLVEDVFTVVVLVLIPVLEPGGAAGSDTTTIATDNAWMAIAEAMGKLVVLIIIVMIAGRRLVPWVLVQVARLRSRELFTLTVLVFSIAVAAGAYAAFGASMALGAFLAGMVVAQSPVSHQAAADALPMRDAFAVLFFVSVGMIFDPAYLFSEPVMLLGALAIILLAKPLSALLLVAALGYSVRTALTVALGLAQIGEFSFILSDLAQKHGLMPESGHSVLVASAIISLSLNPMLFRTLPRIEAWLRRSPRLWATLNARAERRLKQTNAAAAAVIRGSADKAVQRAVVVGYGPVGRTVDRLLRDAGMETVIIDMNMDTVSAIHKGGGLAVYGDAAREPILEQAGIRQASHLVLTLPHASERIAILSAARHLNDRLRVLVRARYLRERADLEQAGASAAVYEEAEAAVALARLVLMDRGASREEVESAVRDLRLRLILENVSNLEAQSVRSVMVPWTRVRKLPATASIDEIRRQVAEQHYSRWPVVDPSNGKPCGYLLVKDLVADFSADADWKRLIRPMRAVDLNDDMQSMLVRLQQEGGTICLVEDRGSPVGLITVENILEQVVGRIEDEYPRHSHILLKDAFKRGHVLLHLHATTPADAIHELVAAIDARHLPPDCDLAALAIARELELPTDVGLGVAIPHARCPGLRHPILVFGRSDDGIVFDPRSNEPVRLIFLLVTASEHPDQQVLMLSQLAGIAGSAALRQELGEAETPEMVAELIARSDPTRAKA
jgi:CPA2 family monovalent cation:H+ antiporter-2